MEESFQVEQAFEEEQEDGEEEEEEAEAEEVEKAEKAGVPPRVKVEVMDTLRSQDEMQQLQLETSPNVKDQISALTVKMEMHSETEDADNKERGDAKSSENRPNSVEKMLQSLKKVKIALPPDRVNKYIKEGKLEKLSNGSYRVMEDVLKEIEGNSSESKINHPKGILNAASDVGDSPAQPAVFKRKRGRPRKGTFVPRTVHERESVRPDDNQIQVTAEGRKILSISTNKEEPICDSTEAGEGETDCESKHKRRRRSKRLDDYVADFNTSDEETEISNKLPKFSSRGRGRGRGRKSISSDLRDGDLFSSYVGVFSKKFSLQEDFTEDDMLDINSESDEDFSNSESPSIIKVLNISEEGSGPNSGIEMSIGPEGKTKLQIIDTGEVSVVNGEENLIYHVITTTGGASTVTPLTVPKELNSDQTEGGDDALSTPQAEKTEVETVAQGNAKRTTMSRSQRIQSKKMVRTYNQKLATLRQQYLQAVQELRKKRLYTLADLVCGASRFLTEEQLVFFTLQLKSGCHHVQSVRYSVREKILALAFYLQSPALYKWLRAIFHLPTKVILERWLEGIAKSDPDSAKRLMYHIYTKYIFKQ